MEENQDNSYKSDHDEKVAYINEEIVNKEYDSDHFKLFLQDKIGEEEIILEKYTLEEIKGFIEEFQQNENNKRNDKNIPHANGSENGNGIEEEAQKENKLCVDPLPTIDNTLLDNEDNNDDDNYISTLKQTKGILSDYHNLTIIISNPIKTSGFMFFGGEYQFTIEVAELSSKVVRSLNDFTFLRETLEMYYPTTYIPPLPSFSLLSSSKEGYLKRKANYLLMFLNTLTQNPLIMSTQLFLDFLQVTQENFTKIKNDYDELDPPTIIKKFNTMEGLLNIKVRSERETEASKIKENIIAKDKQYTKLNEAIKDLLNEFKVISDKMKKVSVAFGDIAKVHDDLPFVQKVYSNFEELTNRYANSYLNQQLVFKEDIQQYFKYTIKNFNTFIDTINDSDKAKKEYERKNVLPTEKALLNKRELKKIDFLKKTYGYFLNKVINEHLSLYRNTEESFKCHLQDLNSKREKLFGDYLSMSSLLEIKNEA